MNEINKLIAHLNEQAQICSTYPQSRKVVPLGVAIDLLKNIYDLGILQGRKTESAEIQKALIDSYKK